MSGPEASLLLWWEQWFPFEGSAKLPPLLPQFPRMNLFGTVEPSGRLPGQIGSSLIRCTMGFGAQRMWVGSQLLSDADTVLVSVQQDWAIISIHVELSERTELGNRHLMAGECLRTLGEPECTPTHIHQCVAFTLL